MEYGTQELKGHGTIAEILRSIISPELTERDMGNECS